MSEAKGAFAIVLVSLAICVAAIMAAPPTNGRSADAAALAAIADAKMVTQRWIDARTGSTKRPSAPEIRNARDALSAIPLGHFHYGSARLVDANLKKIEEEFAAELFEIAAHDTAVE